MIDNSIRFRFLGSVVLIGIITALYFPVRHFDFINFDDNVYITANPAVHSGLRPENVRWAFSSVHGGHWHPLSWIAHMADCEVFGIVPGPAHLMNVAWHALNTALVFVLLCMIGKRTPAITPTLALWIAAIWGVHPMRIESVAWISERKDVLSMFFGLSTCVFYLRYIERPGIRRYLLIVVAFTLGLLSKPSLVPLPLLLLLLDFWPLARLDTRSFFALLIEKSPLLFLAAASAVVAGYSQYHDGAMQSLVQNPPADRLANAFAAYEAYAGNLFFPSGLGIFYPIQVLTPGVGAGCLLGLAAISWWCASQRRLRPELLTGWLWFLISLLPVIGLVQIGGQALANRWTYLPHLGLLIGIAPLLHEQLRRLSTRRVATAMGIAPIAILAFSTHTNLPYWKDSETLFAHTIAVAPNNFMAHLNLGVALQNRGDRQGALMHYEEAARLNPRYPETLNNLGIMRAQSGQFNEAEHLFKRALDIRPNFADAQYNLGVVLSDTGRPLEAITQWIRTIQAHPEYIDAQNQLTRHVDGMFASFCGSAAGTAVPDGLGALISTVQTWAAKPRDADLRARIDTLIVCLQHQR